MSVLWKDRRPTAPMHSFSLNQVVFIAPGTVTYIGRNSATNNALTYTFSSEAIGPAAADRLVVVVAGGLTTAGASAISATIGGVAMTALGFSGTNNACIQILQSSTPTSSTATIVITFSTNSNNCSIDVYNLNGLASMTAFSTATSSGVGVQSLSANIAVPANGVIVAGNATDGTPTTVWTNVNEDADGTIETDSRSVASIANQSSNASLTISSSFSGSVTAALTIASWS